MTPNHSPETEDDPEERAAILEFDAGMNRTDAEAIAGADPINDDQPPPILACLDCRKTGQ